MEAIMRKWREVSLKNPNFSLTMQTFLFLFVLVTALAIGSDRFLTPGNLSNILVQSSYYIILGVAMTLLITTAGIDISIGAMLALTTSFIGTTIMAYGFPVWLGILITLGVSAALGAFNGFLVVVLKVPPLIATLGGFATFRGLAYAYLDGVVYFGFPRSLRFFADGQIAGIPFPIVLALTFIVLGHFFLAHTRTGRHITAIGGNEEAAILAGINVKRIKFYLYTFMGLMVGVTTLIMTARLNSATAVIGQGLEFQTIAAVVVGGTSLFGGRGLMIGTLLGVLLLTILENGLLLAGFGYYWQRVLLGLIFILVVATRTVREKD